MQTLITAVLSFVGTNVDDILILALLFAQAKTGKEVLGVTLGQYLGLSVLFSVSAVGALGVSLLPEGVIGLLGLVPVALGVKTLLFREKENGGDDRRRVGIFGTAIVTIANGADNIAVYIPAFSGFSLLDFCVTVAVFAGMTGLWCLIAHRLGALSFVKRIVERYHDILVSSVLILLGFWILAEHYLI